MTIFRANRSNTSLPKFYLYQMGKPERYVQTKVKFVVLIKGVLIDLEPPHPNNSQVTQNQFFSSICQLYFYVFSIERLYDSKSVFQQLLPTLLLYFFYRKTMNHRNYQFRVSQMIIPFIKFLFIIFVPPSYPYPHCLPRNPPRPPPLSSSPRVNDHPLLVRKIRFLAATGNSLVYVSFPVETLYKSQKLPTKFFQMIKPFIEFVIIIFPPSCPHPNCLPHPPLCHHPHYLSLPHTSG